MNALFLAMTTLLGTSADTASPERAFEHWRRAPVEYRAWHAGHLELTAAQLSSRSGVPIHVVDDATLGNPQIDLSALDEGSTLGEAFDLVARQLPDIKAVGTLNGVFWIHLDKAHAGSLFDRELASPAFSGTFGNFLSQCLLNRVALLAFSNPFGNGPNNSTVEFKRSGKVKLLDALAAVVDANDLVLVLRVSYGDRVVIVDGRRTEPPAVRYHVFDAGPLKVRRAEIARAARHR